MSSKTIGTVKWFNTAKGYGFAINETGEDVFIHYRSIQTEGFKDLKDGQAIEVVQAKSEKGWQAHEVTVLEPT